MSNHLAFISNENYLTMKVNLPKDNGFQKKTPILTLIDDESTHRLTKANAVSFDLKVDPEKDNSPTFKTMVRVLEGNETIRQLLRWRQDVEKVFTGLKAKEVAEKLNALSALMRPSPAAMFNAELGELSAIRFNAALATAAAEDAAQKDNRLLTASRCFTLACLFKKLIGTEFCVATYFCVFLNFKTHSNMFAYLNTLLPFA